MLANQLAWVKIKQGHGIYLGSLIKASKLLYPMLSLPDVVVPYPLEPCSYMVHFCEVGFSLSSMGWLGSKGSLGMAKLGSNS